MLKKTILAATVTACGLFALSTGAVAADPKAPTPVPYGQTVEMNPTVAMSDAVSKAEKAYDARSTSARLRTAHGEIFWAVRLEKADGERLVAYVNGTTGEITSARTLGKSGKSNGSYCDTMGNEHSQGNCMQGMRGHHRGHGCRGY